MNDLDALALDAVALGSASELHGVLCGLMSSGRQPESWCDAVIELLGDEAITDAVTLDAFAGATEVSLHAGDMSFMPLLPGEDESLSSRLEHLGLWCSGFVAGFGLVTAGAELGAEAQELIGDLVAISQIDSDVQIEAGEHIEEGPEHDYMQLCEFVKVATLILCSGGESEGEWAEHAPQSVTSYRHDDETFDEDTDYH